MSQFSWRTAAAVAAVLPMLALSGCSSTGGRQAETGTAAGGGQIAGTPRMTVALVTHGPAGDTFWDIVRKGAQEAAVKDNVELLYTSDPEGGRQAQLIQQAIDQNVDGIAVTLAKPEALKDVLRKAVAAGIPIVSLNSGGDIWQETGAFTHFGSDEILAGAAVGNELTRIGARRPICIIQEQGNVSLDARCAGVKSVIPATEILFVPGTDMTQVSSTVTAKLQATAGVDAVVGLGAPITLTVVRAVGGLNLQDRVKVASFDLNAGLAQAITDGEVAFTVDQQPWLQGYGAIDALWQAKRGGFRIGGGLPVLTGPTIIDGSAAPEVLAFAKEGIR